MRFPKISPRISDREKRKKKKTTTKSLICNQFQGHIGVSNSNNYVFFNYEEKVKSGVILKVSRANFFFIYV